MWVLSLTMGISLWRKARCICNSLVDQIFSMGPALRNNSNEYNSVLLLETSFHDKRWPIDILYPLLLVDIIRTVFIYFMKFSLYQVSISSLKYPLIPTVSHCIPFFTTILCLPHHLIFIFQSLLAPTASIKLFYFPHKRRSTCLYCSLPLLITSVSLPIIGQGSFI